MENLAGLLAMIFVLLVLPLLALLLCTSDDVVALLGLLIGVMLNVSARRNFCFTGCGCSASLAVRNCSSKLKR